MELATANPTHWLKLRDWLQHALGKGKMLIICTQEHHRGEDLEEAKAWRKHNGWAKVWPAALPGQGKGTVAGGACARRHTLGMRCRPTSAPSSSRLPERWRPKEG